MVDMLGQGTSTCKSIQQISLSSGAFRFLRERAQVVWPIASPILFVADPPLNQLTSSSPPQPSKHAQAPLSLAPNSAQHCTTTNHNTNDNLPHDLLHPPIGTRDLRPREVEEPQYAEGRRRVEHHSVLLPSVQMPLRWGDYGGDAQAEGEKEGGWRNTQWAIAAAMESAYKVDLKRADPDLASLNGDDQGGEGTARG